MAITREVREAIETLVKKIRALEERVEKQSAQIDALLEMVDRIASKDDMLNWTDEQWESFLKPFLSKFTKNNSSVNKHNHKNNQQGGDCFAKLGANLINGD